VWGPGLVVPLWPPRALPGAPAAPGRRSGRSGGPAFRHFCPPFGALRRTGRSGGPAFRHFCPPFGALRRFRGDLALSARSMSDFDKNRAETGLLTREWPKLLRFSLATTRSMGH
jgi:hypothetical protein